MFVRINPVMDCRSFPLQNVSRMALVGAVLLTSAMDSEGQVTFGTSQVLTANLGAFARHVALVDVDLDGDLDVVTLESTPTGSILLYENLGEGALADEVEIQDTAVGLHAEMIPTDLDLDGDIDFLVTPTFAQTSLAWYEADGTGGFLPVRSVTDDSRDVSSLRVADLDGDGVQDVLGVDEAGAVVVLPNLGGGRLGPSRVIHDPDERVVEAVAVDLDGDGDFDLAALSEREIRWRVNDGRGNFSGYRPVVRMPRGLSQIEATDVDGDGDTDFLVVRRGQVFWVRNDGSSGFGEPLLLWSLFSSSDRVRLADRDRDGRDEIFYAAPSSRLYAFRQNLGGGAFGPIQVVSPRLTGSPPTDVGDLDGDGIPDLVASGFRLVRVPGGSDRFGERDLISPTLPGATLPTLFDLDRDGQTDIVVATRSEDRLDWLRGLGGGQYARPVTVLAPTTPLANLYVLDTDSDGQPELWAHTEQGSLIHYELDVAAGHLVPVASLSGAGNGARPVQVIDLDVDGDVDLVAGGPNAVLWASQVGPDQFEPFREVVSRANLQGFALGDIDGDGLPDVVASWAERNRARTFLYLNRSEPGTFTRLSDRVRLEETVYGEHYIRDVDGDGDMDALGLAFNRLTLFENEGSFRLSPPQTMISGSFPRFDWIDVDRDGDDDIVSVRTVYPSGTPSQDVTWLEQIEPGEFGQVRVLCDSRFQPERFDLRDADGDGDIDLASTAANTVEICLNESVPTTGEDHPAARSSWLTLRGPNPFRAATQVGVETTVPAVVALIDVLGREVWSREVRPGAVRLDISGASLAPGTYVMRLSTSEETQTLPLVRVAR